MVTPAEIRSFFDAKAQRRADVNSARWSQAKADAEAIIAHIANHYQPTRIWQWGSVLNPRNFTEISDIDIGLEGITDPSTFSAILGEAEEMTSFPLHIVQIDRLMPEFADIIRMKGKIVYVR